MQVNCGHCIAWIQISYMWISNTSVQWDPCNQNTLGQSFRVLIIGVSFFRGYVLWIEINGHSELQMRGRNSAVILGGKKTRCV